MPVGLALQPFLTLPTGNEAIGLGRGLPGGGLKVLVSKAWKRFHFAGNVGYAFYPRATIANLTTGDEFSYGVGVGVSAIPERLDVHLELDGSLTPGPNDRDGTERSFDPAHSPLELALSARAHLPNGLSFLGGVGKGLTSGFGTPDVRIFGGIGWGLQTPRDRDKDGLHDGIDPCVKEPEDEDGYQDEDGCPDPDNDADGILDVADGCPDVPEDKDSWQDEDGCIDPDNDGDGIADGPDACPNEPEDRDGFEDTDGCVDPDNDADGVLDVSDPCPHISEDWDGFQDDDGCPESDNDADSIPDDRDMCPMEAEVVNGVRDFDGCPDDVLAVRTKDAIVIFEKVYFATNKDLILAKSKPVVEAVANVLRANTDVRRVRVEGHTDDVGKDDANLKLSQRRAESVLRELKSRGIDVSRLEAVGYGETRPIDTNRTEDGRERNRRVEFRILSADPPTPRGPAAPSSPAGGSTPANPWGIPTESAPPASGGAENPWGVAPTPPARPTPAAQSAPVAPPAPAVQPASAEEEPTVTVQPNPWGTEPEAAEPTPAAQPAPTDEPAPASDDGKKTEEAPKKKSGSVWGR
jgi:outer membrane protein OmpA-like peptidoglycan-associated protein